METSNFSAEVMVYPIAPNKAKSMRATVICHLYFGGYHIQIREMKLFDSHLNKSGLFLSFPTKKFTAKDGTTQYSDYVKFNLALKALIEEKAIKKYLNMPEQVTPLPQITGDPPSEVTEGYDPNNLDFKKPESKTKPEVKDDEP